MSSKNKVLWILVFLPFLKVSLISAKDFSSESLQAKFEIAEKAIENANLAIFEQLKPELQHYPLYHYLQRDHLLSSFNLDLTNEIETFLTEFGDQPVSKKLRFKWLHWLAQNNHTSLFLRHYRDFGNTQLSCKELEFRLKTSESRQDIFPKIQQLWLNTNHIPRSCTPLFAQWEKAGQMTEEIIWQKLTISVRADKISNARQIIKQKAKVKAAGELLLDIYKKPESLATVNFQFPLTDKANDIILIGIDRLAWRNPNQAIKIWEQLGTKYQINQENSSLKRSISLSLAIEQDPKASDWLMSLSPKDDSSINQWLLSTAIHTKDWSKIASLAQQFADSDEESDKWKYWQAVAETQLGNLSVARQLFEELSGKRQYYGFLAARQLNKAPELSHQTLNYSVAELNEIENFPAAQRAKAFYDLGRLNDARREWNFLAKNTTFENQAKLALITHQWGWQHQAIIDFARSKRIDDVEKRFPLQHFQLYSEQSKQNNIPVSWAYAITRQESAFNTSAISTAGARGLMQLKPSTAKYVAKKSDHYQRASQLLDADTNVTLGTAYLANMLESFQSNPAIATAAYNAGKSRVQQWLETNKTSDTFQWIEQIPYKETRDYVKNVLTYQLIYAQLTNQPDNFISQIASFPTSVNMSLSTAK